MWVFACEHPIAFTVCAIAWAFAVAAMAGEIAKGRRK